MENRDIFNVIVPISGRSFPDLLQINMRGYEAVLKETKNYNDTRV